MRVRPVYYCEPHTFLNTHIMEVQVRVCARVRVMGAIPAGPGPSALENSGPRGVLNSDAIRKAPATHTHYKIVRPHTSVALIV